MRKAVFMLIMLVSLHPAKGQLGSLFWGDNPYFGFSSVFGVALSGGSTWSSELEKPVGSGTLAVDLWRVLQARMSVYGKNNYSIGAGLHTIQTEVFDCGVGYKRYSLSYDKAHFNTFYVQCKPIVFEPLFVNATVEFAHNPVNVEIQRKVIPTFEVGVRYAFGRDSKINYNSRYWGYWF